MIKLLHKSALFMLLASITTANANENDARESREAISIIAGLSVLSLLGWKNLRSTQPWHENLGYGALAGTAGCLTGLAVSDSIARAESINGSAKEELLFRALPLAVGLGAGTLAYYGIKSSFKTPAVVADPNPSLTKRANRFFTKAVNKAVPAVGGFALGNAAGLTAWLAVKHFTNTSK